MKKLVLLASVAAVAVTAALPAAALEMGAPRRAHDREPVQQVQPAGDLALKPLDLGERGEPRRAHDRAGDDVFAYGNGLIDLDLGQLDAPRKANDRGETPAYGDGLIDFGDSKFGEPRRANDRS